MDKGINVLSLFDGISVAQLALRELDIKVEKYFASEIDLNALKVTNYHFPNTIVLGDVRNVFGNNLPKIDLMVFGSPCTDLTSLRKERKGLDGKQSGLFFEALRILQEVKPKYFLMENVSSMSKIDKDNISDLLGFKPIEINSNLVSAQNRNRLYWTNIPHVTLLNDRKIKFQDILQDGFTDRKKSNCLLTKNIALTRAGLKRYLNKSVGQIVFNCKTISELSKKEKLNRFDIVTKHGINKNLVKNFFRKLSTVELEKLQTLPENYVNAVLKPTPANHAIGNSFTLEVIKHLFSSLKILS